MGEKKPPLGKPFAKGESGNPGGRPKLSDELKGKRDMTLARAIEILYEKIHDRKYIAKLQPPELNSLLTTAFDRCGLPKVTQIEGEITDTRRIVLVFPEAAK